MIISTIAVLFTFGLVIFLHEFGHFIVCKLSGIRVEAFSFGFGPELYGRTDKGTRYSVRAIPLGGYVKPAGESLDEASGAPDEYFSKPWYTRLGVVAAGPFMNYLLAFVLFSGVILFVGEPVLSDLPVLGEISQGFPAEKAGLKKGDRVLKLDGVAVGTWSGVAEKIYGKVEKEISITYSRGGAEATVKVKTRKAPDGSGRGVIGITHSMDFGYKKVPFLKGIGMGAHQCWYWTAFTVKTLKSNFDKREKPDLAGPIGIVNIVSKAAHTGLTDLFFLIGLISVAVGFFNLLPIPLLDGGWAVLYIFEGISRRKLTGGIMKYVNGAGIALLLSILLFATYSDIMRLVSSHAAKKEAAATQEGVDKTAKQFGIALPVKDK
ncbi:MAG: M50 family metallopeptidase [Elusimicrobiota bacterium]|nr:M50 family metallopeptidase [Elusimicrobiota bacterium]